MQVPILSISFLTNTEDAQMNTQGGEDGPPPSYTEAIGLPSQEHNAAHTSGHDRIVDEDEKAALTQHDQEHQIALSDAGSSQCLHTPSTPLKFTVHTRKPFLDNAIISIVPTQTLPDIGFWQLRYNNKLNASLRRHAGSPQDRLVLREIANVKFPEYIVPNCGPVIRFEPHEAEVARKGMRHTSATDVFMCCTGWFTTKYKAEFPSALGRAAVTWMVADKSDDAAPDQQNERNSELPPASPPSYAEKNYPSAQQMQVGPAVVQMAGSKTVREDTWTPFPAQALIRDENGDIIATYVRSAPWDKVTGWLTIPQLPDPNESEYSWQEFVEVIVTLCAAMAGMQERVGVVESIIEAGIDNAKFGKGKGKSRDGNAVK